MMKQEKLMNKTTKEFYMINFEKTKSYIKNFFSSNSNVQSNTTGGYDVSFAKPLRRFKAFLIDFVIVYLLLTTLIFLMIKDDIAANIDPIFTDENVETSFEIDSNNNILNAQNVAVETDATTGNTMIKPLTKKERAKQINDIVLRKIQDNKWCGYMIILAPILYKILVLLTKKRATIGQRFFNLMVIKKDGEELKIGDIITRVFMCSICKIKFLIPFTIVVPVFISKNNLTLYDYFTNTYVIELNKK